MLQHSLASSSLGVFQLRIFDSFRTRQNSRHFNTLYTTEYYYNSGDLFMMDKHVGEEEGGESRHSCDTYLHAPLEN